MKNQLGFIGVCAAYLAAAWAVACGSPQESDVGRQQQAVTAAHPTTVSTDADLAVPPRGEIQFYVAREARQTEAGVEFDPVWTERVLALYGGAEVEVRVARERFPNCGLEGTVTAFYRFDKAGEIFSMTLDGGDPEHVRTGRLFLPDGVTTCEMWLRSEREDGCVEYDSRFEENYHFPVHAWTPTVATFDAEWAESVDVELIAGSALVIDYDIERLPKCRINYRGYPSWNIHAWVSFDGAEPQSRPLVRFNYGQGGVPDGTYERELGVFAIPHDATSVALWFENNAYPPVCHEWDSNFGDNYAFPIRDPATVIVSPETVDPVFVDQTSIDTQLLEAWYSQKVIKDNFVGFDDASVRIDLEACPEISEFTRDCSEQVQALTRLEADGPVSPLLRPFTVGFQADAGGRLYAEGLNCSLMEIRTVTQGTALAADSFAGLGFFADGAMAFVPAEALHPVGETTIAAGNEAATIHRFIDVDICWAGTMSSSMHQSYAFKPYARFDATGDDGVLRVYRNWESVPNDHVLGPQRTRRIDRRDALVMP